MHEAHLIQDLLHKIEKIVAENGGGRVVGVRVKLGALSHMSAEHFREHFEQASRGTLAAGAALYAEELKDIHDPRAQDILLESVELAE